MINYSYAKPHFKIKKPGEFINWLNDDRRKHKLENMKGLNAIIIERNGGGGSEIYVHYELKYKMFEFLKLG